MVVNASPEQLRDDIEVLIRLMESGGPCRTCGVAESGHAMTRDGWPINACPHFTPMTVRELGHHVRQVREVFHG